MSKVEHIIEWNVNNIKVNKKHFWHRWIKHTPITVKSNKNVLRIKCNENSELDKKLREMLIEIKKEVASDNIHFIQSHPQPSHFKFVSDQMVNDD